MNGSNEEVGGIEECADEKWEREREKRWAVEEWEIERERNGGISTPSNSSKTPKFFIHHEFIDTPNGSVYWVPIVSASVLPVLGTVYDSLDECIEIYRKYASEAGFGIRLSCQKRLKCGYAKQKYIICNREGCPKDVWLNTLDPKKNDRQYILTTFDVEHNHELDRVDYKYLSKAERKLTYNEQMFIIKATNANIGAVRAHNLYTGLKGSSSLVHGTQTEFKNFTRGVNCFIRDSDAQMLITRMEQRYKIVFVPFMAIDNHRRSVTIGSGLLKKDTAKAYGWLLRAFKKAFVRPPNIVVTDQDGVMRLAVAVKFPESKHQLCMWHIMQKIPAKIVSRIYDDTDFKDKFDHHGSCFFVDSPLCGLMRTTSRSESENSFFSYFTSFGSTLVKFMFCYESAMERKRHTQEKLDHQSFDSFLALLTPLPIVAGSWLCSITGMSSDEGCTVCIIDEEKIKLVGLPEVIDKESSENVEEEINLHQKVTGHYKEQKNRYGEKNEAIKKLAMEASIILDSCVHMLRNNEPKLFVFVNKMKAIKSKLETELPIIPTRTVSNFVQEFMGVKKPNKVKVKNPTMRTCPRKNDVDVLYPADGCSWRQ
nr:hypothetical protein [Tanacetum cinerariifolium]